MEVFFISVLMSWIPYLIGSILLTVILFFLRNYHPFPPFKVGLIIALATALFCSVQPTNTFKVESKRSPNPVAQMSDAEIKAIPPAIEQGRKERKDNFDNLTDWKSRVE